jgi:hypothetical protein
MNQIIIIGYCLFAFGCVIGLTGDIRFLVITYRHGFGWFFVCLFVPMGGLIFFLLFPKESWKPIALSCGGFVIALLGYWMGGIDFIP